MGLVRKSSYAAQHIRSHMDAYVCERVHDNDDKFMCQFHIDLVDVDRCADVASRSSRVWMGDNGRTTHHGIKICVVNCIEELQ